MQFTACTCTCMSQISAHVPVGHNSELCLSTYACLSATLVHVHMYMHNNIMSMALVHGSMQVPLTVLQDQGISVPGTMLQSWRMLLWQIIKIP